MLSRSKGRVTDPAFEREPRAWYHPAERYSFLDILKRLHTQVHPSLLPISVNILSSDWSVGIEHIGMLDVLLSFELVEEFAQFLLRLLGEEIHDMS